MHDPADSPSAPPPPRSAWSHIAGSLRGEHYDYTTGLLPRAILLLAIPMVLEMLLESLFAIVDIWWVGKIDAGWFGSTPTNGAAAAAIGSTEAMISIVYAIAFGLGMAVTALVARRVGEKDLHGAAIAGSEAIGLGIVVGLLLSVPASLFAPELLSWMTSGNERIVAVGSGYARWLFASNIIIVLLFLQNAIFRGAGDPMLALKCLAVSNGLNLILDPCFIFGLGPFPQLGVEGAAVATCTGRGIAVIYQFWLLRRGNGRVQLPQLVRFDAAPMLKMVKLSLGTIGQFLIGTSSWIGLMWGINHFGEAATAGYTIGIRILIFALLPAWGLSNAAATLVGQNLGAGQPDRAERAVWLTGWYDALFLGAVTLVIELFAEPIVGIFTTDPAITAHAVATLRIVASGYVFYAWGMVTVQAFNGAGDTATPTWLHAVFFWLLQLPAAWLFAFHLEYGMPGILWVIPAAESLFAVAAVLLFKRGRWKNVKV